MRPSRRTLGCSPGASPYRHTINDVPHPERLYLLHETGPAAGRSPDAPNLAAARKRQNAPGVELVAFCGALSEDSRSLGPCAKPGRCAGDHLGAGASTVSPEAELGASARLIVDLVEKHRLPAIYATRTYIEEAQGLMAYTPDPVELARHIADQVRRILGGAKAGDIPIYQAAGFGLIVNVKAARLIGLTIPPSLLAQADEVIE